MLNLLRKKKVMKRILWVLAAIIVPAFVLWGAGSSTRSKDNRPSHVGTIYGKKVSFEKLTKSYEACYHQLILSSGGNTKLLEQMLEQMDLSQMAWDRLIMVAEAKKQRIKVADKQVVEAIRMNPLFGRRGMFDNKVYNYVLKNNLRTTPRKFEEEIRENLAITVLRDRAIENLVIREEEILNEYKEREERVKISYILIDPEDYKEGIQSAEGEIKAFYEQNRKTFKKGDEVSIKYFYIKEGEIDLLRKVTEQINNNEAFEKIALENKLEVAETPFFGKNEAIPDIGWSYEVIKAAFRLKKGMTSFPIYTQKGYYVIHLKEKRSGYIPGFEELKSALTESLGKIKAAASAKTRAYEIYEDKETHQFKKSKSFSRREYIEGVGQAESLKKLVFKAETGEVLPPAECEKGFLIARVDEFIPIDESKLEEERDNIKSSLFAQKRTRALQEWFGELSGNAELSIGEEYLP